MCDGSKCQTCCAHLEETSAQSLLGEPEHLGKEDECRICCMTCADLSDHRSDAEGDHISDCEGREVMGCNKLKHLGE
jgi:hypothetical protein